MDENHRIVDDMMYYCGFVDGAGWANNLFIKVARQNGALGAKLTGAGSGGSVFALVKPGAGEKLMDAWRKTAFANHLDDARVFPIRISRSGLIVTQR
jgi:galactokinase